MHSVYTVSNHQRQVYPHLALTISWYCLLIRPNGIKSSIKFFTLTTTINHLTGLWVQCLFFEFQKKKKCFTLLHYICPSCTVQYLTVLRDTFWAVPPPPLTWSQSTLTCFVYIRLIKHSGCHRKYTERPFHTPCSYSQWCYHYTLDEDLNCLKSDNNEPLYSRTYLSAHELLHFNIFDRVLDPN